MLGWLKEKMTKVAVNQCKLNIKINTSTLIYVSNKAYAGISQNGESSDYEKEKVISAQNSLLKDIAIGFAQELTMNDVREVIQDVKNEKEVTVGAEMAIDHVLENSEAELKKLKE